MDAAHVRHHHLFAERGQVDDVIDAAAERLDPFQLLGVAHHVVGHWRREAQQHLDVGDVRRDVIMVPDHVDGELRKALQQHALVTGAHRFLDFGENEDLRHGGRGIKGKAWVWKYGPHRAFGLKWLIGEGENYVGYSDRLAAVDWLYVAVLAVFVFLSTIIGNLISLNRRLMGAVLSAVLFAVAFVFWTLLSAPPAAADPAGRR